MDRETSASRRGRLAPGWLDAPPSAEGWLAAPPPLDGWLAAPPPLDGWLDAPPSESGRGGLHAQSAVSVTCNHMRSGAATVCAAGLQPCVQRRCNRMRSGAATVCTAELQPYVQRRCNRVYSGAAAVCGRHLQPHEPEKLPLTLTSVTSPSPSLYEQVGEVGDPDPLVRVRVRV